ncbi:MAG: hypothetical protein AAF211_25910 [Myxococcota bacterium]
MPREPTWNGRWDTIARNGAAIVGTLPPSVLVVSLICRVLPLDEALAVVVGGLSLPFVWATAVWLLYLVPSALRAWAIVLVSLTGLALATWLLGPMP